LQSIPLTLGPKSSAFSHWHDLLGWYTPNTPDIIQYENIQLIKKQVHLLWCHRTVKLLLGDNLKELAIGYDKIEYQIPIAITTTNLFKRAIERSTTTIKQSTAIQNSTIINKTKQQWRKLGGNDVNHVALVSTMYYAALNTLSQLKLDILSGE